MFKKLLLTTTLLAVVTPWFAAYEEVECSTDPVFNQYSCNQCFNWWEKVEWDNLWLLKDLWMNVTDVDKILYKEEQIDPEMINLDKENVNWIQLPNSNDFWTYTDEFNALYSESEEWYVLPAWKSVTWIKSKLSSVFNLEKNTAEKWSNIGLLVYYIYTHNILKDWEIDIDNTEHKECVLFKSWGAAKKVVAPAPKKLPQTGPAEYILLLLFLSMILGFWILKFKTKS